MEGFLLLIGAISALFVLLPYLLLMWRLTNRQRVVAFAAISVVLLVLSGQVFDLSHPSQNQFLQGIWSFVFFALMLGWFVCGFVHAAVVAVAGCFRALLTFCHGPASQAAPAQD
jgi:formate-dependent nitrite reductase membrane component NrfD